MKTRIWKYCLAAALMLPVMASARDLKPIELGVRAGLTLQNPDMGRLRVGDYDLAADPDVGFTAGITARINLVLFHLQPEVNFNFNGYTLDARSGGATRSADVRHTTVEVPVLVGKRILGFARVAAGPVFNVYSESKLAGRGGVFDAIRIDKKPVSYVLGAGLDIASVCIDLRYNGEFDKSKQNVKLGAASDEYKGGLDFWSFSVGYFF